MQLSLRIGIIGHGKMGQMVKATAIERGHSIAFIAAKTSDPWKDADVLIEFSKPEAVLGNISKALLKDIPMVTGTTGWHDQLEEIEDAVEDADGSLLYASNFSIGVNMTFLINERLAELMNHNPDYFVSIEETHHTEKLDSPSGTAITLAQGVIDKNDYYGGWQESDDVAEGIIPIIAQREPDVPGTHIVRWENEIDRIEIKHEAKSRKGFALGAIIAAEWLHGKSGFYSMRDVLNNTI